MSQAVGHGHDQCHAHHALIADLASGCSFIPFFIDDKLLLKYDSRNYMKMVDMTPMDIIQLHRIEYEAAPDFVVSAPGILKLIGEHTADVLGMFLAMPFNKRLSIAISGRRDSSIRFYAADLNERKRTNISNLKYKREDRWSNYIKGALAIRSMSGSLTRGFNITVLGDIPMDLGLGSASALGCAAVRLVCMATGASCDDEAVLKDVLAVDNLYFERPPRTADYLATIKARENSLLYVDMVSGLTTALPLPSGNAKFLLTDSKVPRPPEDNEILGRSQDCAKGLEFLGGATEGLREFNVGDLDEYMGVMPEHIRRHCMFVIEEMQRVTEAREAALHADLPQFVKALNRSQSGLRNHYEISCPEADWLVKRAMEIPGVHASRLTGKGFGGCIVTIIEENAFDEYRARLEEYERIFGFKPVVWEVEPGSGMTER
jgi:galactokinase